MVKRIVKIFAVVLAVALFASAFVGSDTHPDKQ